MAKKITLRKDFMRVCKGDYALHTMRNGTTYLIAENKDVYYKAA